ncbi:hypothetical protein AB0I84_18510 [Streptomyces spectabilis]|uniref:hypothetical protein n=1 Tax=Streptomyces spectabilis TaxID=68270 RepID=UPI00340946BB
MTKEPKLMTMEEVQALVNAALADPTIDLSAPTMMSLAMREGMRANLLGALNRGDYHPAVGDAPGSLTYRAGGQVSTVPLSPESELLLSAYLNR